MRCGDKDCSEGGFRGSQGCCLRRAFRQEIARQRAFRKAHNNTRQACEKHTDGDFGRHAHLAAHAVANPGRLPTRIRLQTQQSGQHWPCRADLRSWQPHLRLCSKFGGVRGRDGKRREAPIVLQSSLITRRSARHMSATGVGPCLSESDSCQERCSHALT